MLSSVELEPPRDIPFGNYDADLCIDELQKEESSGENGQDQSGENGGDQSGYSEFVRLNNQVHGKMQHISDRYSTSQQSKFVQLPPRPLVDILSSSEDHDESYFDSIYKTV